MYVFSLIIIFQDVFLNLIKMAQRKGKAKVQDRTSMEPVAVPPFLLFEEVS